jgi:transcriptional regulator with XRE-family HTH domain
MSAGDYVRYLRAVKGGPTPLEIEESTGISGSMYRQLEQRYRAIGSEEELTKLAEYFDIPVQELLERQPWTRKELSKFLAEADEESYPVALTLRSGETFAGQVLWHDLGATMLRLENGQELVIQRHMVDHWQILEG